MNLSDSLKIVIVGHVDHGKSTLIGRLLFDTGSIPEKRYQEVADTCRRQGRPFEFAYLMDALEEEREQNVTIDTTQTFFQTSKRPYVIIDAPGHKEFLKNMITGAACADAAILLLDGIEGVREQTRRHAYVLSLLGIRQVIVAVNKLDMVDFCREVFQQAENEIRAFLHTLDIVPTYVVPISARSGENIAAAQGGTVWYNGPSILSALDTFENLRADTRLAFRLPIQDVYKVGTRRIYVGRVATGSVEVGTQVTFLPSGRATKVKSIERWPQGGAQVAGAGESIGLTFDEEIFVERGEVLAPSNDLPIVTEEIKAGVFWLGKRPLQKGETYTLKLATAEGSAVCVDIEERLDSSTLEVIERHAAELHGSESGTVIFALKKAIAADLYLENGPLGRFVIEDNFLIGGGGTVRDLTAAEGSQKAQVIRLDDHFATEPDGNMIDLTRSRGSIEFVVTGRFGDRLAAGERVLFKLRGPKQIEPVALLAYEHNFCFTFSREEDFIALVLFSTAKPATQTAAADIAI
ncbi:MAG: GTP-binding protein [Desulfuromonadales bacterium]|nr:GTP-binding protein [Desulfuromonadales bacterium]